MVIVQIVHLTGFSVLSQLVNWTDDERCHSTYSGDMAHELH